MSALSATLVGDTTTGSHEGKITGTIKSGESKLKVTGIPIATLGSLVEEVDGCGKKTATLDSPTSKVKVNGKKVSRLNDTYTNHGGTKCTIITGSSKLKL